MIVHTRELSLAINQLTKANKRSGFRNTNLAARLMVDFASAGTKKASVSRIHVYMHKPAKKRTGVRHVVAPALKKSKAKLANKYKGTVAAAIKGAQHRKLGRNYPAGTFYRKVDKFVREAKKSVGFWRAGWVPAKRSFRGRGSKRRGDGRFKSKVPGRARAARRSQGTRPHAFMENSARGLASVQPTLLRRQVLPVSIQLLKFAKQDLKKAARRARLV